MIDDGPLLREYTRTGSENAFSELVRRHLDLVYGTAMRRVNGDRALAQDVSLTEQHLYNDGRVREGTVQFARDDTGAWRQVLPPEMMPKLSMIMNDMGGTPTAGGK